jgi:hypothetical protein
MIATISPDLSRPPHGINAIVAANIIQSGRLVSSHLNGIGSLNQRSREPAPAFGQLCRPMLSIYGHGQHAIPTEVSDCDTGDGLAVRRSVPATFLFMKAVVVEGLDQGCPFGWRQKTDCRTPQQFRGGFRPGGLDVALLCGVFHFWC